MHKRYVKKQLLECFKNFIEKKISNIVAHLLYIQLYYIKGILRNVKLFISVSQL